MKILQINSVCGIRSTGRICVDLAELLQKHGHECKIAYGRENVPQEYQKYAIRVGSDVEVKLHGLCSRLFDSHGFGSQRGTENLVKWMKEFNPDIIHLHNIHGYYINIEILFSYLKTCKKKIIWTLHDCWAFTGHCSHFTVAKCEQWKTHCLDCVQRNQYPRSLFFDRCRNNFRRKKQLFTNIPNMIIVTPSNWLASCVRESFLSEYPIYVFPNGIDLEKFKPTPSTLREQYELTDKKIILGVASTWSERKGISDFIKLADLLPESHQIVVLGLTPKQLKKVPKSIMGLKRTNNIKELAQWYTIADVFFNPSREETMGLTSLEALACGTPVIIYDATALPETVADSCSRCVEAGSLNQVLNCLGEVNNIHPIDCINHAKRYEKRMMFEKYIALYENLMK